MVALAVAGVHDIGIEAEFSAERSSLEPVLGGAGTVAGTVAGSNWMELQQAAELESLEPVAVVQQDMALG